MSARRDPRQEYGGTYFVQDGSNEEELTRVAIQDQMITAGMGGVPPEQSDPTHLRRVLDVGCCKCSNFLPIFLILSISALA